MLLIHEAVDCGALWECGCSFRFCEIIALVYSSSIHRTDLCEHVVIRSYATFKYNCSFKSPTVTTATF